MAIAEIGFFSIMTFNKMSTKKQFSFNEKDVVLEGKLIFTKKIVITNDFWRRKENGHEIR
ncbi:hypothetical protein BLX88_21610 [Bacillus obstructivus]|uniref:hypothetical protein n=1 Tax=Heyndrickxia oleronia TaxID=38875 RepID=UPI000903AED3|nr:hypothetical protein [Heyndrickxia oleronia]MBU5212232.1 hypothetical protein [Heyndrickxia oleronia]OJH16744.1 hypothetical protein BLX88_21610 [Bacillus obstructivus]